jgi:NADH:ubiquinone oxidoreductase subunit 3 (subunit A)
MNWLTGPAGSTLLSAFGWARGIRDAFFERSRGNEANMHIQLLSPPISFLIYVILVGGLYGFGRMLAGPTQDTPLKSSIYSSGEAPPTHAAAPGYRPFFAVALFFAIVHLGVLMLGSGNLSLISGIYLIGLMLALVALILG